MLVFRQKVRNVAFKFALCTILSCLALASVALAEDSPGAENLSIFSAEGEVIQSIADDFISGTSRTDFLLKVSDKEIYRLVAGTRTFPKLQPNSRIKVNGTLIDDPRHGASIRISDTVLIAAAQLSEYSPQADARRAVLLRVNFTDAQVGCSVSDIANMMWTGSKSVDGLFQESSFGQLSFTADSDGNGQADVVDVNINHAVSEGKCVPSTWASAANQAAQAKGIDLSIYQHKVYVLPKAAPCSWAGYAYIGCWSSCTSWTKYCSTPDVLAHELGHNLSMHHSSKDTDNDGEIDSEYGDYSCIMGIGGVGWRHFNAVQKTKMGWIPEERQFTAVGNIQRDIALTELNPDSLNPPTSTSTQLIKLAIPKEENWFYYISYRLQVGNYSSRLKDTYKDKINIHRRYNNSSRSLFLSAISEGETWSDTNGVEVTFQSRPDAYSARVNIILPPVKRVGDFPSAPTNLRVNSP